AITAGWVELEGHVVPFPKKFPDEAAAIRQGMNRGLLEVANHGYTHCMRADGAFRPRRWTGNRYFHREFREEVPEAQHREHLARSQGILEDYFATRVVTFVPPGGVFTKATALLAVEHGLRFLSSSQGSAQGPVPGLTFIDDG